MRLQELRLKCYRSYVGYRVDLNDLRERHAELKRSGMLLGEIVRALANHYGVTADHVRGLLRREGLEVSRTAARPEIVLPDDLPTGAVVFAACAGNLVWIGYTSGLRKMLSFLAVYSPIRVEYAGAHRSAAARRVARDLHELLKDHRHHGEWFTRNDVVEAALVRLGIHLPPSRR